MTTKTKTADPEPEATTFEKDGLQRTTTVPVEKVELAAAGWRPVKAAPAEKAETGEQESAEEKTAPRAGRGQSK